MGTPFAPAHPDPSEVRKLLNAPNDTPKGLRDKAIMELFYSSAIRRAEMARLTLQDVDIKNGVVRVLRGKGGKDRVVPIGQSACEALTRYLKEARALWLKVRLNPGNRPMRSGSTPSSRTRNCARKRIGAHQRGIRHAAFWDGTSPRTSGVTVAPRIWSPTARTSFMCSGCSATLRWKPRRFTPASACRT